MNITLSPSVPRAGLRAISSKSAAHRILICSAFSTTPTKIRCDDVNRDITATADCLRALGAAVTYQAPYFYVKPVEAPARRAMLPCGESGSTLRFLLPIVCAIGAEAGFEMQGRLPERPLSPLYEELTSHGAILSPQGSNPLFCGGALDGGEYKIRGDVSSQFISGLLFALTFSKKGGRIVIDGKLESAPYVDMTADALSLFGAPPKKTDHGYLVVPGSTLTCQECIEVEGDWSNAAFPLCMGAIGRGEVTVSGLDLDSKQGDMKITELLGRFGASVTLGNGSCTVRGGSKLRGIEIDASQIPDLVPVLSVVASVAEGTTVIKGASRLRLKESDRLSSVSAMINSLGGNAKVTDDGLVINGAPSLDGGHVDSCNDHRIAMSAAVASVVCKNKVTIEDAECVSKSYPAFWTDIQTFLGITVENQ